MSLIGGQNDREPDARQSRAAAFEMDFLALVRPGEIHGDIVDVEHRNILRTVIMARHPEFGSDDAVCLGESTDERIAGIAAVQPAARRDEHHAATCAALGRETEFV